MTPRQKFILALEGKQPPGRVPHFELVFFLTMEQKKQWLNWVKFMRCQHR